MLERWACSAAFPRSDLLARGDLTTDRPESHPDARLEGLPLWSRPRRAYQRVLRCPHCHLSWNLYTPTGEPNEWLCRAA